MFGPRIVDFSTHFPGPLATHLLTEIGADVVKIENPRSGDANRELKPSVRGEGLFHVMLNAGERSLAIDRRAPDWPHVVAAAARWADAVVVSGRVPELVSRRVDYPTILAANDRIVYCMLPAYGNVGPWKDWSAHGQNIDALAGNIVMSVDDDGLPTSAPGWRGPATTATGVFAALGVLAGLVRRDAGGGPQCVEVSLWGAGLWWNWRDLLVRANTGDAWGASETKRSRYTMYWTADRRALLICPVERKFWEAFCDLLDLPAEMRGRGCWTSGHSMDLGIGAEYMGERPVIQERIGRRTMAEWTTVLGGAGIPVAPVLTVEEAMNSDHAAAEGFLRWVPGRVDPAGSFRMPRSPVRFLRDGVPGADVPIELGAAPLIGEHTEEASTMLGIDSAPGIPR